MFVIKITFAKESLILTIGIILLLNETRCERRSECLKYENCVNNKCVPGNQVNFLKCKIQSDCKDYEFCHPEFKICELKRGRCVIDYDCANHQSCSELINVCVDQFFD